ncbi:uncharacterized protein [Primulina eburnea]|uniref:uncharacterized protein n=1 Tax=Primulina eburnea TaxID=1245227 RepID=UPI003C6CC094
MEFNTNHHEESEQESTYMRAGRFYECVFCKRGFDTAQALGGHMNIHRKDRARNKPTTPSKREEDCTGPRFYQQIPTSRIIDHNYSTYFSTGTSTTPSSENPPQKGGSMNDFDRDRRKRTNQSINPGDWPVRSVFPPMITEGLETNHDEELDLELRLGYDS